jgi:hypothetical protein
MEIGGIEILEDVVRWVLYGQSVTEERFFQALGSPLPVFISPSAPYSLNIRGEAEKSLAL